MANEERCQDKDSGTAPTATGNLGRAKPVQKTPPVDPKKTVILRKIMEENENKRGKK